jgi:hypothetical protein
VRTLTKVELFDVSPVTFPAYPQTDVGVRAELRTIAQAKLKELSGVPVDEEQVKALFESRAQARREFIAANTPPADKWSYAEILKRCRVTAT